MVWAKAGLIRESVMAKLLVAGKGAPKPDGKTRVGGLPLAPKGMPWPRCKECGGRMQFLAQFYLPDTGLESLKAREQSLLVFQCQNNPGMCDEWDADLGGNAAILVSATKLVPMSAPALTPQDRKEGRDGPTSLDQAQAIRTVHYDDTRQAEYDDDAYVEAVQKKGSAVVGKLGGRAVWIQDPETPRCSCGRKMVFVAQIESNAGGGINFGDFGTGYAFICKRCKSKAKFLWQCS